MNNADLYDFTSEENQGKWKGVLTNALKKVLDQVHPKMYAREDALDYIEGLCLRLLAMLCEKPSPRTVQDVECRVQSTFPKPIDIWALRDAREALEKGKKRSVLPVDKIHNMLKDVLLYKIDSQVSLFLVAVLEYISADILKLAGNYVKNIKRLEITYQDVQISMNADKALMDMFYQDHTSTSGHPTCDASLSNAQHPTSPNSSLAMSSHLHPHRMNFSSSFPNTNDQQSTIQQYEDAVRELMASERAYLRELRMLVYVFREELLKLGAAPKDLDVVFSCLGDICELTVTLLGSLEDAVEMAQEHGMACVGSCLEELAEAKEFDVYVRYGEDVTSVEGRSVLKRLLTGPEVESKLASAGQSMRLALRYHLPSLLLTPVRHGRLYLEHIIHLKSLSTVKEDQEALDTAECLLQPLHAELVRFAARAGVLMMTAVAGGVGGRYGALPLGGGARARRQVALDKLAELSRTVEGWQEVARDVGQCCDEFVREGTLLKGTAGSSTSSRRAPSERRAYLFDGILFLCKPIQQPTITTIFPGVIVGGNLPSSSTVIGGGSTAIGGTGAGGGASVVGGAGSAVLSNVASVVAGVAGGGSGTDKGDKVGGTVVESKLKERFSLRKVEIIDHRRNDDDLPTTSSSTQSTQSPTPSNTSSTTSHHLHSHHHHHHHHHHSSSISSLASVTSTLTSNSSNSPLSAATGSSSGTGVLQGAPQGGGVGDNVHAFEIAPRHSTSCLLFASSAEEKEAWLADLVMLNTRPLLDRVLDGLLLDVERAHPLRLPGRDEYRFAEPDCRENIILEQPALPTSPSATAASSTTTPGVPLIKGATLVKLVERLTYHVYADPQLVKTFLTTYRSFCSPSELLSLLEERFRIPELTVAGAVAAEGVGDAATTGGSVLGMNVMMVARDDCKRYKKDFLQPVQFRVLNVLRHWVDQHFYDFEHDPKLLEDLHDFLSSIAVGKGMRKWVDSVLKIVQRKSEPGGAQSRAIKCVFDEKPPKIEWHLTQNPDEFNILTLHPLELARQLTILEFDLYRYIRPSELVGSVWTKKDKERTSPNLLRMIKHTTDVTRWYEKNIVEAQNIDERVAIVGRILEIMGHLDDLNNFNGYLAAVSAMGSASVHRLKLTFGAMPQSQRKALDECRQPDDHFKKYQEKLRSINPPCVPFLGMYLTNILHIEEGNPDHLPNTGLINFFKRRKVAEITGEIQQYQNQPYYYDVEQTIRHYLENLCPFGDKPDNEISDYLYNCSLEIEPRKCKQVPKFPRKYPNTSLKAPPTVKPPRVNSHNKQRVKERQEQLLMQQMQREREQREREEREKQERAMAQLQSQTQSNRDNSDCSIFANIIIPNPQGKGDSTASSPTTSPPPTSPPAAVPNIPPNVGPGPPIPSWQRIPPGGPGSPGPRSPLSPHLNNADPPPPISPRRVGANQISGAWSVPPPGTPPPLPPRRPPSYHGIRKDSNSNNSPDSGGGMTSPKHRPVVDGAPQLPPKDPSPPPLPPRPAPRLNPAHMSQLHQRRQQRISGGAVAPGPSGGSGRPPAVVPQPHPGGSSASNGPSGQMPVSPLTPLLPPRSAALRNSTSAMQQTAQQFQFPSPPMRQQQQPDQSTTTTLPTRPTSTSTTRQTTNTMTAVSPPIILASTGVISPAAVVVSQQQVVADKQ